MSPRIKVRNEMRELVGQITGLSDDRVHLYRMDSIEKDETPCASVYLARLNSELETMGGSESAERKLRIYVDFHLDKKITDLNNDADAIMDEWLMELEQLVLNKAMNGGFADGAIRIIELDEAEFRPTERSRERRGDLVTEWVVEYDERIKS